MQTAADIVNTLGGTVSVARELGVPVSTVSSWKQANSIPDWRHRDLVALADRLGVEINLESSSSTAAVAVCGVCERGADEPEVHACTAVDCGLRQRAAA